MRAPAPLGLTPDAVYHAFRAHGRTEAACRSLGCSRQAIHDRNDLREAARRGADEWRAEQPAEVIERVRLPHELAARLADMARAAGQSRQVYLGRVLAAIESLPGPVASEGGSGGPIVPILLPAVERDRLRRLAGEDFTGAVRAALAEHAAKR